MISHETRRYEQCKVTFNSDVYIAISEIGKEEKYPAILLSDRMIDGTVDLTTVPCILEFKNAEAIDGLIESLVDIKRKLRDG